MKRSTPADAPTAMPKAHGWDAADFVRNVDPYIATAMVVLLGLGTVLVYSASAVRAEDMGGGSTRFLFRHLVALALGFGALAATVRIPVDRWSTWATALMVATIAMLVLVFVPGLGREANGAVRWLGVGPFSVQPAEIGKLAAAVYLAHVLAKKREQISEFSVGFVPPVAIVGGTALLVLVQPDFGTAAVLVAMLGVMLFVAGTRIAYLVFAVGAAAPFALHYVATRPHARARIVAFMNPEAYRADIGYQAWESLVSFGSGGVFGLGLGRGNQKLFFLPESHTDFIFSVVGQELGFFGVLIVVAAFVILVGRSFQIASELPCRFPMFLVIAIGTWIGLQALVHMGVAVAILPTKGLTLPFVSFGRSSLIVTMAAMGIVLRASAEQRAHASGVSPRRKKS